MSENINHNVVAAVNDQKAKICALLCLGNCTSKLILCTSLRQIS